MSHQSRSCDTATTAAEQFLSVQYEEAFNGTVEVLDP